MTMKNLLPITAAFAILTGSAHAEAPVVGVYVLGPENTARLIMPAESALRAGEGVTVLIPRESGGDPHRATVIVDGPARATENDLVTFDDPAVLSVAPLSAEDHFGIAVPGLDEGAAPDLDGNGVAEMPVICTSGESVQMALAEGAGDAMRLVWYQAIYLGYDTEPTCTDAFYAAVDRAM